MEHNILHTAKDINWTKLSKVTIPCIRRLEKSETLQEIEDKPTQNIRSLSEENNIMPSTDWMLMGKLVQSIFNNSDAAPFREPVDWKGLGLYDYPQIVKKPMDLGQIKRKIEKEEYATLHEAAQDVRLVWENCKTYNADGSDFYLLAENFSKKFEDKYGKMLKELNITNPKKGGGSAKGDVITEPSLDDKKLFAKRLYKISKEDLGKVIIDLDALCPQSITKNSAEDQVEINVDNITPEAFHSVMEFVSVCVGEASGRKKKSAATGKAKSKGR